MIERPIVHIFLQGTNIPFDVRPYRAISFRLDHPDHLEKAKEELKAAVDAVGQPDYAVVNPVTSARGKIRLQEHATPEQKVLLEQINEIGERLLIVERRLNFSDDPNVRAVVEALRRRSRLSLADIVSPVCTENSNPRIVVMNPAEDRV